MIFFDINEKTHWKSLKKTTTKIYFFSLDVPAMQLKTQRGKTRWVWCNQWAVFNHHRACSVSSGWWVWGWKQNRQVQMIRCISTAENTVQLHNVALHAKSAGPLADAPLKQPALIKGPIIQSSLRCVNELVWCFQTGNSFPLLHTDTHNTLCSLTTQTETCFSSEMTQESAWKKKYLWMKHCRNKKALHDAWKQSAKVKLSESLFLNTQRRDQLASNGDPKHLQLNVDRTTTHAVKPRHPYMQRWNLCQYLDNTH